MEILCGPDGELPEKLKNLEPRLIEHVSNEIMDRDPNVRWDDIGNIRRLIISSVFRLLAIFDLHAVFVSIFPIAQ